MATGDNYFYYILQNQDRQNIQEYFNPPFIDKSEFVNGKFIDKSGLTEEQKEKYFNTVNYKLKARISQQHNFQVIVDDDGSGDNEDKTARLLENGLYIFSLSGPGYNNQNNHSMFESELDSNNDLIPWTKNTLKDKLYIYKFDEHTKEFKWRREKETDEDYYLFWEGTYSFAENILVFHFSRSGFKTLNDKRDESDKYKNYPTNEVPIKYYGMMAAPIHNSHDNSIALAVFIDNSEIDLMSVYSLPGFDTNEYILGLADTINPGGRGQMITDLIGISGLTSNSNFGISYRVGEYISGTDTIIKNTNEEMFKAVHGTDTEIEPFDSLSIESYDNKYGGYGGNIFRNSFDFYERRNPIAQNGHVKIQYIGPYETMHRDFEINILKDDGITEDDGIILAKYSYLDDNYDSGTNINRIIPGIENNVYIRILDRKKELDLEESKFVRIYPDPDNSIVSTSLSECEYFTLTELDNHRRKLSFNVSSLFRDCTFKLNLRLVKRKFYFAIVRDDKINSVRIKKNSSNSSDNLEYVEFKHEDDDKNEVNKKYYFEADDSLTIEIKFKEDNYAIIHNLLESYLGIDDKGPLKNPIYLVTPNTERTDTPDKPSPAKSGSISLSNNKIQTISFIMPPKDVVLFLKTKRLYTLTVINDINYIENINQNNKTYKKISPIIKTYFYNDFVFIRIFFPEQNDNPSMQNIEISFMEIDRQAMTSQYSQINFEDRGDYETNVGYHSLYQDMWFYMPNYDLTLTIKLKDYRGKLYVAKEYNDDYLAHLYIADINDNKLQKIANKDQTWWEFQYSPDDPIDVRVYFAAESTMLSGAEVSGILISGVISGTKIPGTAISGSSGNIQISGLSGWANERNEILSGMLFLKDDYNQRILSIPDSEKEEIKSKLSDYDDRLRELKTNYENLVKGIYLATLQETSGIYEYFRLDNKFISSQFKGTLWTSDSGVISGSDKDDKKSGPLIDASGNLILGNPSLPASHQNNKNKFVPGDIWIKPRLDDDDNLLNGFSCLYQDLFFIMPDGGFSLLLKDESILVDLIINPEITQSETDKKQINTVIIFHKKEKELIDRNFPCQIINEIVVDETVNIYVKFNDKNSKIDETHFLNQFDLTYQTKDISKKYNNNEYLSDGTTLNPDYNPYIIKVYEPWYPDNDDDYKGLTEYKKDNAMIKINDPDKLLYQRITFRMPKNKMTLYLKYVERLYNLTVNFNTSSVIESIKSIISPYSPFSKKTENFTGSVKCSYNDEVHIEFKLISPYKLSLKGSYKVDKNNKEEYYTTQSTYYIKGGSSPSYPNYNDSFYLYPSSNYICVHMVNHDLTLNAELEIPINSYIYKVANEEKSLPLPEGAYFIKVAGGNGGKGGNGGTGRVKTDISGVEPPKIIYDASGNISGFEGGGSTTQNNVEAKQEAGVSGIWGASGTLYESLSFKVPSTVAISGIINFTWDIGQFGEDGKNGSVRAGGGGGAGGGATLLSFDRPIGNIYNIYSPGGNGGNGGDSGDIANIRVEVEIAEGVRDNMSALKTTGDTSKTSFDDNITVSKNSYTDTVVENSKSKTESANTNLRNAQTGFRTIKQEFDISVSTGITTSFYNARAEFFNAKSDLESKRRTISTSLSTLQSIQNDISNNRSSIVSANTYIDSAINNLNSAIGTLTSTTYLSDASSDLDSAIAIIDDKINEISDTIAILDDQIADLNNQITILDNQIADIDNQITTLDDQITDIDDQIDDLDDQIADLDNQIVDIDDQIVILDDQINDPNTDETDLESLIIQKDDLISQKNDLELEKNDLESDKNDFILQKNDLESDKNDLELEKDDLELEKDDLELEKDDLILQKNNLELEKDDLDIIKNNIIVYKTDLDGMPPTDMATQLNDANTRYSNAIPALETALANFVPLITIYNSVLKVYDDAKTDFESARTQLGIVNDNLNEAKTTVGQLKLSIDSEIIRVPADSLYNSVRTKLSAAHNKANTLESNMTSHITSSSAIYDTLDSAFNTINNADVLTADDLNTAISNFGTNPDNWTEVNAKSIETAAANINDYINLTAIDYNHTSIISGILSYTYQPYNTPSSIQNARDGLNNSSLTLNTTVSDLGQALNLAEGIVAAKNIELSKATGAGGDGGLGQSNNDIMEDKDKGEDGTKGGDFVGTGVNTSAGGEGGIGGVGKKFTGVETKYTSGDGEQPIDYPSIVSTGIKSRYIYNNPTLQTPKYGYIFIIRLDN